jgi:hypothetical protein
MQRFEKKNRGELRAKIGLDRLREREWLFFYVKN